MFSIHDKPARLCDGLSRRELLRVGGLGAFGLSAGQLSSARGESLATGNPAGLPGFGKARSCIVLFLLGGPPQHETWDPKPHAPAEIRGDFQPIASAIPGLHVGEMMPKTAALADRVSVLRAVATDDNAHSASGYWMLTGSPHPPKSVENAWTGAPNDWPCLAAVVRHLRGDTSRLPASIRLPEEIWNTGHIVWPGQDAGRLGAAADPWLITCDPNAADFQVPQLALPAQMPLVRLRQRQSLLTALNTARRQVEKNVAVQRWSGLGDRTFDLLQSDQARRAFAIEKEPPAVRDRYGRSRFSQSVLLSRRLIEAGVRLVPVNWTRVKGYVNQGGPGIMQASLDSGSFDKFILADGMYGDDLLTNVEGDLTGTFGTVPGTDSKGAATYADMANAAGLKGSGPFTGESYDAAALLILAMQSAGSTDGAAIASNVMGVANAPGEKIMPGELAKGLRILANGGAVDYVGASNVELTGVGEASGSYKEFEIRNKAFQTVRFR